jgi:hypothetical protein
MMKPRLRHPSPASETVSHLFHVALSSNAYFVLLDRSGPLQFEKQESTLRKGVRGTRQLQKKQYAQHLPTRRSVRRRCAGLQQS